MSKILGSWSGMRKYLEQEMLAACLHGRVRYNCTAYAGMDGCHVFEVYIDNELVKQFSLETVNTFFINNRCKEKTDYFGLGEYWDEFWSVLDKTPVQSRTEYTDNEFCDALEQYRNQSIKDSINSDNPIVKMFAILDRRVGKRTLASVVEAMEQLPLWLQHFYELRLKSDSVI